VKLNSTTTCSGDGPECPKCGHVIVPTEDRHYDPYRYTNDKCPKCAACFSVDVQILTGIWSCEVAT
jgi:hypothetical protein